MEYVELPLHGKLGIGKKTLVDGDYDGEYFSQYRWYLGENGYVYRREDRKNIYLHHEVLKVPVGHWRDHINRNKLDNRSSNLRAVTPRDNARNRDDSGKAGISGVVGITQVYVKPKNKDRGYKINAWRVRYRGLYLGYYKTIEEAQIALDKARTK